MLAQRSSFHCYRPAPMGRAATHSGGIDEDDLAVLDGSHLQQLDVLDGGAVAGIDSQAVDFDGACGHNKIAAASFAQRIVRDFAGLERGADNSGVRADRQCVGIVSEIRRLA